MDSTQGRSKSWISGKGKENLGAASKGLVHSNGLFIVAVVQEIPRGIYKGLLSDLCAIIYLLLLLLTRYRSSLVYRKWQNGIIMLLPA